jgi:hypothetical protein
MSCRPYQISTIATSCGSNIPSIKKLWIGAFESATFTVSNVTGVTDADGNPVIEKVTSAVLNCNEDAWVEFQFKRNTCSATSEMTVNDNGSHYYTNSVNLVFAKQDASKRLSIQALASGDCACIYLDGNGNYWLLGYENPVSLTSASAATGTSVSDSNQYDLVLSEEAGILPIPVIATADFDTNILTPLTTTTTCP